MNNEMFLTMRRLCQMITEHETNNSLDCLVSLPVKMHSALKCRSQI